MSAGWVAGSTRARGLLGDRVGAERARRAAAAGSLPAAADHLLGTRFSGIGESGGLAAAQRQVALRSLTELRLLAGWLPLGAGELVRALGGWFELVNVEDRLAYLGGAELVAPLPLGSLSSVWPRAAAAGSAGEIRAALRGSVWGDPGGEDPAAIHLGMRLALARRIARTAPEARAWAAGAAALMVARERFLGGGGRTQVAAAAVPELGAAWAQAATLDVFVRALPPRAAWPFGDVSDPLELWRLEAGWWRRVSADGEALVRANRHGRAVLVGVVALLAADAVRTSAALAAAAWANAAAREAFDAVA